MKRFSYVCLFYMRTNNKAASRKIIYADNLKKPVISVLSREVLNETKCISSVSNAMLLRGSNEELKHFSWEALWQEMHTKMPIFAIIFAPNLV